MMYSGFVLSAILAFLLGISIGYYLSPLTPVGSISSIVIQYALVAGAGLGMWKIITDYLKQNVFEYGGIFKKQETRVTFEKEGWTPQEKERHAETVYYLRITKKRGQGRLEDCEGHIVIHDIDGSEINVSTVWEGSDYERYRNVSIQGDLKLFHISEDQKKILMFSEHDKSRNRFPDEVYQAPLQDQLNSTILVKLGASSGTLPKKPFTMKIGEIIEGAKK